MEPVIQSPKSSLNLASLKAAFSSHHRSCSSVKSSMSTAANSKPAQKTLQSFFTGTGKPPTCNPNVKKDLTSCSPVGKSVLDGFRYGRGPCIDTDSEKDMAPSSWDSIKEPDGQDSPELVTDSVKNETLPETSDKSNITPEDSKGETEPSSYNEHFTVSPDAKRARTDNPSSPAEHKVSSSSTVDAPVCFQRRAVPLQFSLQELTGKIRRLQDQKKERANEELLYRRFRAKINPGENQSAEEELKKEIR